jgi:hypothetical protein
MNTIEPDTTLDVSPYSGGQVNGHFTAQELSEAYNVSDSTIRNRWFTWLKKVAPETLLKTPKGYTALARSLFDEFSLVKPGDRDAWVTKAKAHYSQEWATVGVIEAELMPDEVGGMLALQQTQVQTIELSVAQQLADLEAMIDQVNAAEVNLSDAELRAATARGQQRAIALHGAELQAELQTTNLLRQRRLNCGQQ